MAEKFTWFPKLTATLEKVPDELRAEMAWALVKYGTYGEEPELQWPLDAIFESLREDIDNSKTSRTAGAKGGKSGKKAKSAPKNNPPCETGETPLATPLENENKGGCENDQPKPYQTNTYQAINPPNPPEGEFDDNEEFAAFAVECIAAFNEETGQDYRSSGGRDWLDLRRIWDNGRTVDDVRAVARAKLRDWGRDPKMRKFVRPSTLFGPKFEEYLAECGGLKAAPSEPCPDCGRAMVPIGEVVESPKDPTRMWCPACRKAHGGKGAAA